MQAGANLAGALMHSTFALVLQQRFELTSKQNGLVLSWVGVCIAVGELVVRLLGEVTGLRKKISVHYQSTQLHPSQWRAGVCHLVPQLLGCINSSCHVQP
jgi:hypothetical protein